MRSGEPAARHVASLESKSEWYSVSSTYRMAQIEQYTQNTAQETNQTTADPVIVSHVLPNGEQGLGLR